MCPEVAGFGTVWTPVSKVRRAAPLWLEMRVELYAGGRMTDEKRAAHAKALFDFVVAWVSPGLPGMLPAVVKACIIQGSEPLVLASIIRTVPAEEREALLELAAYRRTIYRTSKMIDVGHGRKERVFANLYDALFAQLAIHGEYGSKDHELYRGQRDSRWLLEASYYRGLRDQPKYHDDRAKVVSSFYGIHEVPFDEMSTVEVQERAAFFHRKYPQVSLVGLTPLQQEAVIQHYLSGTKLLDFTTSIYVSAFFATAFFGPCPESGRPEMGAIYGIAAREIDALAMARVDAPELPAKFGRIHLQSGVFLRIRFREAINDPGLWPRWIFHHTDVAYPFRCLERGVTLESLLPEEIS